MNKIEQLLQQLCPEGVEFKKLGEICVVLRGKRLTKKELSSDGNYPVFHGGLIPLGRYNNFNRKAFQTMVINTGSVGEVVWSDVDFWSSDGTFTIQTNELINDRFLYFFLKIQEPYLKTQKREGGVPTISREAVENIQIPIPPLPIQQEIVTILDSFTQLEAELEAELEARRKQYEYYRNKLLNATEVNGKWLMNGVEVEWKTLGEIVNIQRGVRVVRSQLLENGQYPVYQNSMKPLGYFQKYNYKANTTFIISAGAAGDVGYSKVDFWAADDCFLCLCPDNLKSKFLYYVLLCNQTYLYSRVRRASVPRLSREAIAKIKIPIPPLPEQERIVGILDKFDALVNDISIGLPAEIEARRKQYEYYRGKLLSFDVKANK